MQISNEEQSQKILIPAAKTIEIISIDEIIRLEAMQNYSKVYLQDGRVIITIKNLRHYKENLESQPFFSCHKSHLVNETRIRRYHKEGLVEMSDDSLVPVSRRLRDQFVSRLAELFGLSSKKELTFNKVQKLRKMAL